MSTRSARLQVLNASQLKVTRNELPLEARQPAIDVLNGVVAEMIDISLAARHAHWNVRSRSFMQLHELFGRINRDLANEIDELGERIAALGGVARGTVQAVAGETALDPFPTMVTSEQELIDALSQRLGQLATALHHAIEACEPLRDAVSVNHLTDAAAVVEKLLWLAESHLQPAHS